MSSADTLLAGPYLQLLRAPTHDLQSGDGLIHTAYMLVKLAFRRELLELTLEMVKETKDFFDTHHSMRCDGCGERRDYRKQWVQTDFELFVLCEDCAVKLGVKCT